jgi:hypothetical protein
MTDASPGDVFAALYAAHQAGDHWVQTSAQARDKGLRGWAGRRACAAHVAGLTACKAAALAILHVSGHRIGWKRAAVVIAADAGSHYWADRRDIAVPAGLPRLAFATGHREFWMLGLPRPGRDDNPVLGTGSYALDQAWHIACLWAAAAVIGSARPAP